ncbi:RNA-guided endonuclease InsQ/TnpB family protein [Finegoldia magna]|uniref:Transposase n=1 Tax=Finegoldia magna (strain ATCC 29328 / DSM 20472 / WAL 2508) TaxID=334413 RepID=B0S4J9_FINM2|nr:RNA-guided endonuclease TnpB family protein [Finegoldia magna]UEA71129.1 transposase [Finegoldia magna]BAG09190.1 transposase [Finegoldia magna ATCC 29328]
MLITYKTEIKPNPEQVIKIKQTMGVCRFIYNFYIVENQKAYKNNMPFITAFNFSKWLNNVFIPNNLNYSWIRDVSSKSVKQSIVCAERAFKRFFKKESKFPRFKKKNKSNVKMYFVRNNKGDCLCERHRIKIPTLGWIKIKEKGYIPTSKDDYVVKSGAISYKAGRYYISCLVDIEEPPKQILKPFGLGIDLGLEKFAVISNGNVYKNINKSKKIIKLEKKLRHEQKCLSRKYEQLKNNKKGESTHKNILKQIAKVQKTHLKLSNIRTDYINKIINELVKTKPAYIVIENLNISGMIKNRYLSKSISNQRFYEFRQKLFNKCNFHGIELRIADRFYPSSKTCHSCGSIKKDLKLSDRIYKCPTCGEIIDRDLNASLNLRDTTSYKIA